MMPASAHASSVQHHHPTVADAFVAAVESRLAEIVGGDVRLERAAARLLMARHAKRARARVCGAVARALDVSWERARDAAVVVELVHGASLLHDDVVDRADRRRGVPTVNAEDGNAFAVLCGDLVLARALELTTALPHGDRMVRDVLDVLVRMTRAAVLEIEARGALPAPQEGIDTWYEMAAGKTGALFGLCGTLVGRAAGIDDVDLSGSLERFGVAFQLVDDLLDVSGGDEGKARGQDLRERALNHTVLSAALADASYASAVRIAWSGPHVDEGDVMALCERAMELGAAATVDEARRAVQDGSRHAALRAEVVPWAVRLVERAMIGAGR